MQSIKEALLGLKEPTIDVVLFVGEVKDALNLRNEYMFLL
jgi:hypothetical protein